MNINSLLRHNPVPCRYGAPLGQANYMDDEGPLHLQQVRIDAQGYAPDGVYWGHGEPLWCAFNDGSRVYVRAWTRADAMAQVIEFDECAVFKRGAK